VDKTVLTLAVDSSQVGTAAAALERMTGAGNAAATAGAKVTASSAAQRRAVTQSAEAASKGKVSFTDLAAASAKLSPNAMKQITAALAATAAEANKAATAVQALQGAAAAPTVLATAPAAAQPLVRATTAAPNARTPLVSPIPTAAVSGLAIPTLAADTGRAVTAIDRLTAAAKTQRSALTQLTPVVSATSDSYRQLSAVPVRLAAPQGLSAASAALQTLSTQAGSARAAVTALNSVPAPRPQVAPAQATQVLSAAAASRQLADQQRDQAKAARLAAFQNQQLGYQLNDFFVQVSSGQSPLTAFIQQGSQLSGTYGGIGNAFRAITSLLSPMRLLFGGVATAVGALGYAFYEGSRQSKAFADAIVLTGNYAGQSEGQFNALTRQIAAHGQVTVGAAREIQQALISTGQIGPEVFAAAAQAAALYAQATGKSAEDVAQDFATMSRAPSKFALEHNRVFNDISAKQYEVIKAFEDNGKAADAQGVIYEAIIARFGQLSNNLGYLDKVLRNGKGLWSQFWDAAFDIGRKETIEDKIATLSANLAKTRPNAAGQQPGGFALPNGLNRGGTPGRQDAYELQDLLTRQGLDQANATNTAAKAEINKAAQAADAVVDSYLKRGKAASEYHKKLDELNRSFKDKQAAGVPVSAADQKVALIQLKKDFTPAGGANEAAQVLRAQLDNDIKAIKDALDAEKDALNFQQRYVQGVYQAGQVSLKDYYDNRRAAIADGVAAELVELDKESARLQKYLTQTKDPSEKIVTRTKINEIGAQKEKLSAAASREVVLANQEEAASFKALGEQVINYRANLLQMQGDEAGAARLRAQTAIQNARLLAAQAKNLPGAAPVDVSALERAIALTDQFSEVQRQAGILSVNSSRAEEAFALAAQQSGKSLVESERGIYAVRVTELEQLGVLVVKARELADASTDPRIKSFASDLALEYAKAASAIDPALNRLRDANKELATGLASTIGNIPNAFADAYRQQRSESDAYVKSQRETYNQQIKDLQGYLAQSRNEQDRASLRKRISQLQGEENGIKGQSKARSALDALSKSVVEPIGKQVFATVNKLLIQDPLQKYLEGQLKGLTEGGGPLAGFLNDALGIKTDPKDQALAVQTAAIYSSRDALDVLTQAASAAADALRAPMPGFGRDAAGTDAGAADAVPVDNALAGAQYDAITATDKFSKDATTAAADISRLAAAAGDGTGALGRLPSIISLFQSAVAAMSASGGASGGGGLFSSIGKLFGVGSSAAGMGYEEASALTGIFHEGGVVGSPPARRTVSQAVFAGAPRYHTGGIVGKAADKAREHLKHNEVPAILMGGPKGRREEVLHASDPRHRDNLGMSALAQIMAESKAGLRVRGARELGGPVSPDSLYRVNEKPGQPELLQVAGKQYLMTGGQGGTIQPTAASDKRGGDTHIHLTVTPPPGASRASALQFGAEVGRQIQRSQRNR
jgi:hypothetical protein